MDESRPSCASGGPREDYNLSLHIGALFIILGVSAGACALPIIALRIPQLRIPPNALFLFRHFGTGVLIATAFVHLFPTAFISLTDPCLPHFFNDQYPAFAGAIALAAVFVITIVEMVFSPGRSLCSGSATDTVPESQESFATNRSMADDEITPGMYPGGLCVAYANAPPSSKHSTVWPDPIRERRPQSQENNGPQSGMSI